MAGDGGVLADVEASAVLEVSVVSVDVAVSVVSAVWAAVPVCRDGVLRRVVPDACRVGGGLPLHCYSFCRSSLRGVR